MPNIDSFPFDILQAQDPNAPENRLYQPYFLDMDTCETLILQSIPLEINYDPGQNWSTIPAPGRNNPLYQYCGAEDTMSFTISWYGNEESRQDVIRKTKWLEAISKNDGYDKKPHRLQFRMGNLFRDTIWILVASPVKWSLFNRVAGMLPCLAIQEITLKRVMTENRSTLQIKKIDT